MKNFLKLLCLFCALGVQAATQPVVIDNVTGNFYTNGVQWIPASGASTNSIAPVWTNWTLNTTYSNVSGASWFIGADAIMTGAAVAGNINVTIYAGQGGAGYTNLAKRTFSTVGTSLPTTNRVPINLPLGNGMWFYFTNESVGAGNSVIITNGYYATISGTNGAPGQSGPVTSYNMTQFSTNGAILAITNGAILTNIYAFTPTLDGGTTFTNGSLGGSGAITNWARTHLFNTVTLGTNAAHSPAIRFLDYLGVPNSQSYSIEGQSGQFQFWSINDSGGHVGANPWLNVNTTNVAVNFYNMPITFNVATTNASAVSMTGLGGSGAFLAADSTSGLVYRTNAPAGSGSIEAGTNSGGGLFTAYVGKNDTNLQFNTFNSSSSVLLSSNANIITFAERWLTNVITSVTSAGTSETNLIVYTVPAGTLAVDRDTLVCRMSGGFAANGNSKQLKIKFGTTTIFDTTSLVLNNAYWVATVEIHRTGAATQVSNVSFTSGSATLAASSFVTTPAETLSGAINLSCTATTPGASGDMIQYSLTVKKVTQ